MKHYVYIIECVNDSYYTGYTTDIQRRYREHQQGTAKCRYTRSFKPRKLLIFWEYPTRSEALSAERRIKSLSKQEKTLLLRSDILP
ncbi:MAG: GIY-YIG nuclease family protein [Gammaproteobacteria bacterium]|nr:GIY-YIG nuclease family protein [Gammaproteobacteria bacterium]